MLRLSAGHPLLNFQEPLRTKTESPETERRQAVLDSFYSKIDSDSKMGIPVDRLSYFDIVRGDAGHFQRLCQQLTETHVYSPIATWRATLIGEGIMESSANGHPFPGREFCYRVAHSRRTFHIDAPQFVAFVAADESTGRPAEGLALQCVALEGTALRGSRRAETFSEWCAARHARDQSVARLQKPLAIYAVSTIGVEDTAFALRFRCFRL